MHELSIAQNIVEIAIEKMKNHGGNQVLSLQIEVGVLSGVVKDCLEFVFPEACRSTPLEGCTLDVEVVSLEMKCRSCGVCSIDGEGDDEVYLICKQCGSIRIEILKGKELRILSMEVQ